MKMNVCDELIDWLSYKPIRGDDDLLNLLILDYFEDLNEPNLSESPNKIKNWTSQNPKYTESSSSSFIQRDIYLSKSVKSVSSGSTNRSALRLASSTIRHEASVNSSSTSSKATLIDAYYDIFKSFHLQISLKPSSLKLTSRQTKSHLTLNLPSIDVKSVGTKCDLEEELIGAKLVEFPCTYLRACEKTSNKLPWVIELKGFSFLADREVLTSVDLNALFTLKPKYHNHDNLLSSLGVLFNIHVTKKVKSLFLKIFKIIEKSSFLILSEFFYFF